MEANDELTGRGEVGTRAAGTGCETVHLIASGVDATELGQCNQVLAGGIDADALKELPVFGAEGVTQGNHIEFQIVTTLQKVVAHDGVCGTGNVVILAFCNLLPVKLRVP